MSYTTADIAHVLLALAALLAASHGLGWVFARFRQPRVIGEISGGLLLGPTLLGHVLPGVYGTVFPDRGPTPAVLGALYHLGLFMLMFCSGAELRAVFQRGETRVVFAITLAGTVLPFVAGLAFVGAADTTPLWGPNANGVSFLLVFAVAVAITSIPVISRIMSDLGILETSFARIVLGAAVIEDIVLYVVLAVALGVATHFQAEFGLAGLLHLPQEKEWIASYHVTATLVFFAVALLAGPRLYTAAEGTRWNLVRRSNRIAFQLVFLLVTTLFCVFLGVAPIFGAFVAGIINGVAAEHPTRPRVRSREAIKNFAFAFFIPLYFAIVGLKLDLLRAFDPLFFAGFLAFACAAKAASVYAGAKLAGESHAAAWNLAIAMNARGGPGIVLASVSYDAGLISGGFYGVLVLLAVVTSLLAGSWLEYVVRSKRPLR